LNLSPAFVVGLNKDQRVSDEQPEIIQRIGREVREHETTLKLHDERLRGLERDFMEMSKDFKEVQAALTKMEVLILTLNRDVTAGIHVIEKNIRLAISEHEGKEFLNQRHVTLWLASTLLAIVGAIAWFVFERVAGNGL
jgi:hypothetical protein